MPEELAFLRCVVGCLSWAPAMEYEILEQAFAQAGADLAEERKRRAAFESQAVADARERDALMASVRSLEALVAARSSEENAQAERAGKATALLAERDAELAMAREELHLERELVAAVRQQVDAAEVERSASTARIDVLRARLADAEETAEVGRETSTEPSGAAWEALLHQQVRALELGLAARDDELGALREQLSGARREFARLSDDAQLAAAREQAATEVARLSAEVAACRALAEAKTAEASAATASADLARARLAEQAHWLSRRDAQLESTRREAAALRDENQALLGRQQLTARRDAGRGARPDDDDDDDAGAAAAGPHAAGLAAADDAGGGEVPDAAASWEARARTLQESVHALERQLTDGLASSRLRLAAEAEATQRAHGELQATQQALSGARAQASEAAAALRAAESRAATLDAEQRTKGMEVSRLAAELGAMQARLAASAQEVRSADQLALAAREQRSHGERELARLREAAGTRDQMSAQLHAALAKESERVARAWEQRERLRSTLQARDDQLAKARAELSGAKEALSAATDELEQLREQRKLSEILLRVCAPTHRAHLPLAASRPTSLPAATSAARQHPTRSPSRAPNSASEADAFDPCP